MIDIFARALLAHEVMGLLKYPLVLLSDVLGIDEDEVAVDRDLKTRNDEGELPVDEAVA